MAGGCVTTFSSLSEAAIRQSHAAPNKLPGGQRMWHGAGIRIANDTVVQEVGAQIAERSCRGPYFIGAELLKNETTC